MEHITFKVKIIDAGNSPFKEGSEMTINYDDKGSNGKPQPSEVQLEFNFKRKGGR